MYLLQKLFQLENQKLSTDMFPDSMYNSKWTIGNFYFSKKGIQV